MTEVKTARQVARKTQKDVADEVRINIRVYQKYEAGMGAKTIRAAIRIARALGTTVEKLWGTAKAAVL